MDATHVYWSDTFGGGDDEQEEVQPEEKSRQLEVEVATLKKELAETRKELAAKAVQLSKRDQSDKAVHEKWAEQRAAELTAAALAPKEQLIKSLEQAVEQLELTLAQRTEELEETRRLFSSQKRALKDALSAAAEREAAEAEANAAGRSAATAAAEEEMERLLQELSALKTRSALELQSREADIQALKTQLAQHEAIRRQAVDDAVAAAAAESAAALQTLQAQHAAELAELQSELSRARSSSGGCKYRQEEHQDLSSALVDLAAVNKEKVQVQREFEAYKDLTAQTARQHREEQARLMEENASLKARIAAEAARVAMGGTHPRVDSGVHISLRGKTFPAVQDGGSLVDQWISRLEGQRKGLVPLLVLGTVVLLFLTIAVVRAAASARGEDKGTLCFLAKLGIQIGEGCGSTILDRSSALGAALDRIAVDPTPLVDHSSNGVSTAAVTGGGSVAGDATVGMGLRHRMLLSQWQSPGGFLLSIAGGLGMYCAYLLYKIG